MILRLGLVRVDRSLAIVQVGRPGITSHQLRKLDLARRRRVRRPPRRPAPVEGGSVGGGGGGGVTGVFSSVGGVEGPPRPRLLRRGGERPSGLGGEPPPPARSRSARLSIGDKLGSSSSIACSAFLTVSSRRLSTGPGGEVEGGLGANRTGGSKLLGTGAGGGASSGAGASSFLSAETGPAGAPRCCV